MKITRHAVGQMLSHGTHVFPLEAYGILVAHEAEDTMVQICATLPVGKTRFWFESVGRFDGLSRAWSLAGTFFEHIRPRRIYLTFPDALPGKAEEARCVASAFPGAKFVFWQPLFGGEVLTAPCVEVRRPGGWEDIQIGTPKRHSTDPHFNARRLKSAWRSD